MKQFLLVLCGIPASGKTLLAIEIQKQVQDDVDIVSTDEWRDEVFYSAFTPEKENKVRENALKNTKTLLSKGKSIIHDDTNYYASMRHELYELARLRACVFAVVHITTPLKVALDWNRRREVVIPDHVIRRIHSKLDEPGRRYAWDKPIARVNLAAIGTSIAASEILQGLESKRPISTTKIGSEESMQTLRDKETRLVVAEFLLENRGLRSDDDVHRIRKTILHIAKEKNYSVEETKKHLLSELSKLVKRVS